jgi:hypothetical protein
MSSVYKSAIKTPFFVVLDSVFKRFVGCFAKFEYYDKLIESLHDDESIKEIFEVDEDEELTKEHVKELFETSDYYIVPHYELDLNKTIYISLTGNYHFECISNDKLEDESGVVLIFSPDDTWITH